MKKLLFFFMLFILVFSLSAENYMKLYIKRTNDEYTVIFVDSAGNIIKEEKAYLWKPDTVVKDTLIAEESDKVEKDKGKNNNIYGIKFENFRIILPPHWEIALSGATAGGYYAPILSSSLIPDNSPSQAYIGMSILVWVGMTFPPLIWMGNWNLDYAAGAISSYNYAFGPIDGLMLSSLYQDITSNTLDDRIILGGGAGLGFLYNGISFYYMRNKGLEHKYGDLYGINGMIGYFWGFMLGDITGINTGIASFSTSALMRGLGFYMANKGWLAGDGMMCLLNSMVGAGVGGESYAIYNSYVSSSVDPKVIEGIILTTSIGGYLTTLYLTKGGMFTEISSTLMFAGALVGSSIGSSLAALYSMTFDNYPPFPIITGTTIGMEYLVYKLIKNNMPSLLNIKTDVSFYPIKNGVGFTYSF